MLANLVSTLQTNALFDIAIIIIIATFVAYIIRLLKQPLILAYVLTGLILGPVFLGLVKDQNIVLILSEVGIAFLLFFVGLEINFKKLKQITGVSLVVTCIQVALTFLAGFYLSLYFGLNQISAFYIGAIVAFSSTMVVVKLLSDKDELDTLHSRIILGILLIQDIIVIFLLAILNKIDENFTLTVLYGPLFKGVILFALAILFSKFIFVKIFDFAAKSRELLLFCALAVCFLFSLLSAYLGFSIVIGAFIAGLSLASLPYSIDIAGEVSPLKNFFALLFFVALGMQLKLDSFNFSLNFLIYLLLIVILLKPLIIMIITSIFGYDKRTSFLSSMSLGQISEFSLIIVLLGLQLGHIDSSIFSLTIILAVITMVLTSYLIHYDKKISNFFAGILNVFEKLSLRERRIHCLMKKKPKIIIFGCHRMGSIFLQSFEKMKKKVLMIDFNPEIIEDLIEKKKNCLYGDIMNEEVLKLANIRKASLVVSTVKDEERSLFLLDYVKRYNKKAKIIVTARYLKEALQYYKKGASYVIIPHILTAEKISDLLKQIVKKKSVINKVKRKHIKHLSNMNMFGR